MRAPITCETILSSNSIPQSNADTQYHTTCPSTYEVWSGLAVGTVCVGVSNGEFSLYNISTQYLYYYSCFFCLLICILRKNNSNLRAWTLIVNLLAAKRGNFNAPIVQRILNRNAENASQFIWNKLCWLEAHIQIMNFKITIITVKSLATAKTPASQRLVFSKKHTADLTSTKSFLFENDVLHRNEKVRSFNIVNIYTIIIFLADWYDDNHVMVWYQLNKIPDEY